MVNWKVVHYLSYIAVLFFALEPSYIHPDEHFQSLEVLTRTYNDSIITTQTLTFQYRPILELFYEYTVGIRSSKPQ